jgi:hypothetical protein
VPLLKGTYNGHRLTDLPVPMPLAHLHRNTIRHLIIEDPLKNRVFTDKELFFVAAALKNGNSSVVSLQIMGCEGITGDESLIALFEALERHPAIRSIGIRSITRCRRMQEKLTPSVMAAIDKPRGNQKKLHPPFVFGSHEINKCTMSGKVDPPPCISEVGAGAALCKLVCRNPSIIHVEIGRQIALGTSGGLMATKKGTPTQLEGLSAVWQRERISLLGTTRPSATVGVNPLPSMKVKRRISSLIREGGCGIECRECQCGGCFTANG